MYMTSWCGLLQNKQGFMCPHRGIIVVGDESPQSLLKHTLHCIFQMLLCSGWCHSKLAWERMRRVVIWQHSRYLGLCCWGWHRRLYDHFSPAAAGFVLPAVSSAASTLMGGIAELSEKSWFPLSPKADYDRGLLKLKNSRQTASNVFTAQLLKIQLISLAVPESLSSPMLSAKPVCLKVNFLDVFLRCKKV